MTVFRLAGFLLHLAVILYSSTAQASDYCEYAYGVFVSLLGTHGAGTGGTVHAVARKMAHVVLFFSLGSWLYHSFRESETRRLCLAISLSLMVGAVSEGVQLWYPERQALLSDVLLNLASATLAAALAARLESPAASRSK